MSLDIRSDGCRIITTAEGDTINFGSFFIISEVDSDVELGQGECLTSYWLHNVPKMLFSIGACCTALYLANQFLFQAEYQCDHMGPC